MVGREGQDALDFIRLRMDLGNTRLYDDTVDADASFAHIGNRILLILRHGMVQDGDETASILHETGGSASEFICADQVYATGTNFCCLKNDIYRVRRHLRNKIVRGAVIPEEHFRIKRSILFGRRDDFKLFQLGKKDPHFLLRNLKDTAFPGADDLLAIALDRLVDRKREWTAFEGGTEDEIERHVQKFGYPLGGSDFRESSAVFPARYARLGDTKFLGQL